ncbi:MAG: hypothetical protein EOP56_17105 [Sphingobacteriales bacterium]|nr:MAG: hypothetical protein EOP56_17105 [Sphingobacteriales bacterium]
MKVKNNKSYAFFLSLLALVGATTQVIARPTVETSGQRPASQNKGQLKTTASCRPAESSIDLDINNVRARLMTGGDMWWDNGTSEARYEVPKGSRKNALFAGSVWVGGIDVQNQLKVCAQTYRSSGNDYWPGPLDLTANVDEATCSAWDRFWKINATDIARFRQLSDKRTALDNDEAFEAIRTWPGKGSTVAEGRNRSQITVSTTQDYAPFVDVDLDNRYDPYAGDYPDIDGDQYIWWVFNDKGNVKLQSQTEGIGMEVQASAFGYTRQDAMNDATFYNYRLVNRGGLTLDSCYMATWTDADLGYAFDDYIGCDTPRGLGILYNGRSEDGNGEITSYGREVPMVGVDFFKGPWRYIDTSIGGKDTTIRRRMDMTVFTYFNNGAGVIGDPTNGAQIYFYMTGSTRTGQRFSNDFQGPGVTSRGFGQGPLSSWIFTGDPASKTTWSECTCNNPPYDRRFIHSAGPFQLDPGVVNDVTIGAVWVSDVGGCPNTSFKKIQAADDLAQALFDNDFKAIEGPEAPRVVVREMDRKLVFYLANDPNSNNFGEGFGYNMSDARYRVKALSTKAVSDTTSDSLYKFEGYRVFQLKDGNVRAADVFLPTGEVNTALAIEVFQCDIKNGITQIVNYNKSPDIEGVYNAAIKVTGRDSGIQHSFEIANDQFATGLDKRLVNYKNYYFVAVAYAYNNFKPFKLDSLQYTQDLVYLGSEKGQGGTAIPIVSGMPNPANGSMGTTIGADYGTGVIIKRIEGRGNGGNAIQLSDSSELEALAGPRYQSLYPRYKQGEGPVTLKVVDPLKVKPADWELYVMGTETDNPTIADNSTGIKDSSATWKLVDVTNGRTIMSEKTMLVANEQILEDYGISLTMQQVKNPGYNQNENNGYINSTILFADATKPWLSGVNDAESRDFRNWIRSGGLGNDTSTTCNFNDKIGPGYDTATQAYESMFPQYTSTRATWAPYALGAEENRPACGFGITKPSSAPLLYSLPSVDLVFTSDKSKWTRCVVVETQDSRDLAEGKGEKFKPRQHAGWNGDLDANGRPVYSSDPSDRGMSWFPGYAINQETGERLNIVFGEDSWLKSYNGADMIWNPVRESLVASGNVSDVLKVFGGRHYVYIVNTKYDEGKSFKEGILNSSDIIVNSTYRRVVWTGMPLLAPNSNFNSLADGLIPTETRLRFRVERPYARYVPDSAATLRNGGYPMYEFTTKGLEPRALADNPGADKDRLLERIGVTPNPYYAFSGYERNRLDTRVRVINLPKRAVINIYTLDGALVRRLEKDNPNQSFIDWDLRNARGLTVGSGMYLIHVNAEGVGETVLRWFGALRPIDIVQY